VDFLCIIYVEELMAYQIFALENDVLEIRCTHGITHMRKQRETWTVDEDDRKECFPNRGAALDRAREIAGDLNLPVH